MDIIANKLIVAKKKMKNVICDIYLGWKWHKMLTTGGVEKCHVVGIWKWIK